MIVAICNENMLLKDVNLFSKRFCIYNPDSTQITTLPYVYTSTKRFAYSPSYQPKMVSYTTLYNLCKK